VTVGKVNRYTSVAKDVNSLPDIHNLMYICANTQKHIQVYLSIHSFPLDWAAP